MQRSITLGELPVCFEVDEDGDVRVSVDGSPGCLLQGEEVLAAAQVLLVALEVQACKRAARRRRR